MVSNKDLVLQDVELCKKIAPILERLGISYQCEQLEKVKADPAALLFVLTETLLREQPDTDPIIRNVIRRDFSGRK